MVGERVPDRFWLGVPLHYVQKRGNELENFNGGLPPFSQHSIYKNFQFKFLKKKMEKRIYKPMTRLSGEQVTIVQLHGSTESPSQFSSTPWGS